MAKSTIKDFEKQVRDAADLVESTGKPGTVYDGDGLELRITPTGARSFLFRYYRPGTKTRAVLTLGKADLLTLKEARAAAAAARAKVAQGIDPGTEKKSAKQAMERKQTETFGAQFADMMATRGKKLSDRHRKALQDRYDLHLAEHLEGVPVSEVTAALVVKLVEGIAAEGIGDTASRCGRLMIQVMDWAASGGVIASHSCGAAKLRLEAIKPPVTNSPFIPAITLMPAILAASLEHTTRHALLWQIHTLARSAEVAGAQWDEIDRERGLWIIPKERMKMNRDHIVPLTAAMVAILETMERTRRGVFIFPGRSSYSTHIHKQTTYYAIKGALAGTGLHMVAHGIRALGSTVLNDAGFPGDLVELALAHVDRNTVRSIYNKAEYIGARRAMLSWWSDYIEAAGRGETITRDGSQDNVVSMRGAA